MPAELRHLGHEAPVVVQQAGARHVSGPGDVPGDRVDGLDVAAEPLGCPRVQQRHLGARRLLGGERRQRAGVQVVVRHRDIAGFGVTEPLSSSTPPRGHPPSRIRTSSMPAAVSTHQARADPARFQSS